jgi:hypothetical protein
MTAKLLEAGRLTQSETDKIQNCYSLAIKRNINNLEDMQRDVWAIFFHTLSKMRNASMVFAQVVMTIDVNSRTVPVQGFAYEHEHSLPAAVMDAIKPAFRGLPSIDFLKRCVREETQKPSECLTLSFGQEYPKLFCKA